VALTHRFQTPPSYEAFTAALARGQGTAGGVTGLSYTMAKHWPDMVKRKAYEALLLIWQDRTVPAYWKWRWLIPIPKCPDPGLADLRPIMLLEVLRKAWTSIIVREIMEVIEAEGVLSGSQHAFRGHRGTDSASLSLRNALEQARFLSQDIYLASWDIKRAFDSVSKSLCAFAWKRLGVPPWLAAWLTALDENGFTFVRSEFTFECWCKDSYEGLSHLTAGGAPVHFDPERGTGQGDVSSPATWIDIFDIILRTLEVAAYPDEGVPLALPSGARAVAPDVACADDLISPAGSLRGLQRKAAIVSVCMGVLGLEVAVPKLRIRKKCWGNPQRTLAPERLLLHTRRGTPVSVPVRHTGVFRFLGVDYDLDGNDRDQFDRFAASLRGMTAVIHSKRATAETVLAVLRSSTISKVTYIGALAPWPLSWYQELDTILAREYRFRTKNLSTSQRANLFIPPELGGLGMPSLTDIIQGRKRSIFERSLEGDQALQLAADSCLRRATERDRSNHTMWASSLLEWGMMGGASLRWTQSLPEDLPGDQEVAMVLPGTSWRVERPHSWLRDQTRVYTVDAIVGARLTVRVGELVDGNPRGLPEMWVTYPTRNRRGPQFYTFQDLFAGAEVRQLTVSHPAVFNPRPSHLRSARVGHRLIAERTVTPRLPPPREVEDPPLPGDPPWTCFVNTLRRRAGEDMLTRLFCVPGWRVGGQLLVGYEKERYSWAARTYLCEDLTHVMTPSLLLLTLGLILRAILDGAQRGGPGQVIVDNEGLTRLLLAPDRSRHWDSSQAGHLKRSIRKALASHPLIMLRSQKCPRVDRKPLDTWSALERGLHTGLRILLEEGDPESWIMDGGRVHRSMLDLGALLPAHHLTPQWAWLESSSTSFVLREDRWARHEAARLEAAELRDDGLRGGGPLNGSPCLYGMRRPWQTWSNWLSPTVRSGSASCLIVTSPSAPTGSNPSMWRTPSMPPRPNVPYAGSWTRGSTGPCTVCEWSSASAESDT